MRESETEVDGKKTVQRDNQGVEVRKKLTAKKKKKKKKIIDFIINF